MYVDTAIASTVNQGFEELLWKAAYNLRRTVESLEYIYAVLSLTFLKFGNDKFYVSRIEKVFEK